MSPAYNVPTRIYLLMSNIALISYVGNFFIPIWIFKKSVFNPIPRKQQGHKAQTDISQTNFLKIFTLNGSTKHLNLKYSWVYIFAIFLIKNIFLGHNFFLVKCILLMAELLITNEPFPAALHHKSPINKESIGFVTNRN